MKKSGMFLIGALFLSMATGSFCNESPRAKLSILIREGKTTEAEALMESAGIEIDSLAERAEESPLVEAATYGRVELMEYLLKHGAYAEGVSHKKRTPMTQVIKACTVRLPPQKVIKAVELLLEHGADVNGVGEEGYTPLMLAAKHTRSTQLLSLLCQRGADVDYIASNRMTALILALRNNNVIAFSTLLSLGADINVYKNETLLHWIVLDGNIGMARFLIEQQGIDVNIRNDFSQTPLMIASRKGHFAMVKFLLEHNAEINVTTSEDIYYEIPDKQFISLSKQYYVVPAGATALTFARHLGGSLQVKDYLIEQGAVEESSQDSLNIVTRYNW